VPFDVRKETTLIQNFKHHIRNFAKGELFAVSLVFDNAGYQVDFQLVAIGNIIGVADENRQARLIALRKKIRATDFARMAFTPAILMTKGACPGLTLIRSYCRQR